MKFVDCTWELANLGKHTCEVCFEENDVFNVKEILGNTQTYDYVVVKVPMNRPDVNFGLSDVGFTMIETQLNISKRYNDFNFDDRLVRRLYPHVSDQIVKEQAELENVLGKMTPDMFSTDRIYLDPHFGYESSYKRYTNWMKTEFEKGNTIIKNIFFDSKEVGFSMHREEIGIVHGLLGGIYKEFQEEGYGLLTACVEYFAAHRENKPFKRMCTAISSNNVPMLQIYNYLQFKVDKMNYVFVKHNI